MSSFFIRRPIFAIVISIIIVILGALSLLSLPIAQYPQISLPTVNLSTTYTGANATIVNQTVAQVIEDQLKGVDDMSYMSSTSSNDGSYSLSVVFSLDSDGNTDAINVQNDANLAKNSLPSDVQTQGLTVRRSSGDMVLMANLYSPNGTYNQAFLKNYADIYLLDKIQRIDGVGNVNTFGSSYAMRVWLNPEKLAERGLTVSDVVSAIKEQNMSAPAGTIGSLPAPATQEKQYSAKVEGQLSTPEQFGNIILKSASNGQFVYLKDVANIQTGTQNEISNSKINGKTGIGFGIQLSSDANALDTITEVKKVLDQAKETFPPDLDYTIVMDNTNFINASINEVKDTFVESLLLVILVVFVFLQKWRTTLIPVLAVPVSIVGTFVSFKVLDFTINTLTLFAMVLAIGLVVDDAIVVIENVEEHMSKDKQSAKDATEAAMKEVQGPIIATTAVLASIFIPVAFIGGVTGVLYKQFAVTITISVVISVFVALTLTPALCGVLLKPGDKAIQGGPLGAFFRGFNRAFDHFKDRYTGKVGWMIRHLKYAAVFLILVTGLMGICYQVLPSTFVPDEDQGVFMASITMPEGTSLNQTVKTVDAAAEETRQIPGVKDVMTHAGGSLWSRRLRIHHPPAGNFVQCQHERLFEQCLHANRRHHDYRPGSEERHPHRRVRQRARRQGHRPDGSRRHRIQAAPAANPHDGLYGHHRLPAPGLCQRSWCWSPLRHGCCRCRRYDLCHPMWPAPYPGILYHLRKNGPQLLESHGTETNQIQIPHVEAVKKSLSHVRQAFLSG